MVVELGSGKYTSVVRDNWAKLPEEIVLGDVAAVGVDRNDRVYAFNRGEHPVAVFDAEGNLLRSWGEGIFTRLHGVHCALILALLITAAPAEAQFPSPVGDISGVVSNPGSDPGPTPPEPAAAAGFTTLALNMDFTGTTQSELNGVPFNAQSLSSWLDCAGASSPIWNQEATTPVTSSCEFSIITDSANGLQTLDIGYTTADYASGALATQMTSCDALGETCSLTLPMGGYVEIVLRVPTATSTAYTAGANANYGSPLWSWYSTATGGYEWHYLDLYSTGVNGGESACCGGTVPSSYVSGYNVNQYNTYGWLTTSDGSTDAAVCAYTNSIAVDSGGASACFNYGNIGATAFASRNYLISNIGPQTTGYGAPANNMNLYIQSIRVWECPNWLTAQCNGTVYLSAP